MSPTSIVLPNMTMVTHNFRGAVTALATAAIAVAVAIAITVRNPYMDEIFHVPQAQHTCAGVWVWNNKITTPPGLYVLSAVPSFILNVVANIPFIPTSIRILLRNTSAILCSLDALRAVGPICLLLVFAFLVQLCRQTKSIGPTNTTNMDPNANVDSYAIHRALSIVSTPFLFFFAFLYYTDVPSLLCVVSTVCLASRQLHKTAAFVGLISLCFRQTNIIWVLFATTIAFNHMLQHHLKLTFPTSMYRISRFFIEFSRASLSQLDVVIATLLPYAFVGVAFIMFVIGNGGIALGDKSNHQASLHFPQFFYFSLVLFTMLAPSVVTMKSLTKLRNTFTKSPKMFVLFSLASIALILLLIHKFTVVHPFIISDNRHYVFYLWKRIFGRHPIIPYLFAPIYYCILLLLGAKLSLHMDPLVHISFWICTITVLITSPLIEFRYYIVPYVIYTANIRFGDSLTTSITKSSTSTQRTRGKRQKEIATSKDIAFILATYYPITISIIVNIITIYVFVARPFYDPTWYPTNPEMYLQRFMW